MNGEDLFEATTYNALCITLCTDESRYIDTDSHYIHIPKLLFVKYATKINLNNVCFEISNSNTDTELNTKIYFKKIEPSMGEFESNVLIPHWACKKLNIQSCGDKVILKIIPEPNIIKRCKIKGSDSSYVKTDIKTLLEEKINQFKCVNLETQFTINKTIFTIIELISTKNKPINYGITLNELEIDFDIPDDIKLLERKKIIIDKITEKINIKINLINELKNKYKSKKTGVVKFSEFLTNMTNYSQIDSNVNFDEIKVELTEEIKKSIDLGEKTFIPTDIDLLEQLIEESKIVQKKMIDDYKQLQTSAKSNIFEGTGYKLCESNISTTNLNSISDTTLSNTENLTKEQIRKLRLSKFSK